jgi:hypothetical protein
MSSSQKASLSGSGSGGLLDEKVFTRQAFAGQKSELFAPESAPLKDALFSVLKSTWSAENLEFIEALHKLNNSNASSEEFKKELQRIEETYIVVNADSRMNIKSGTLDKILNNPDKSIANYAEAIKEVFDLISTNVTKDTKNLVNMDKILMVNNAGAQLLKAFDEMLPDKKVGRVSQIFKREETLLLSSQNACKTAQQELRDLLTKPAVSGAEHEKTFSKVVMETLPKLSAAFQELKAFEASHPDAVKKSPGIEKIIDTIAEADKKVFGVDPAQRRRSSSRSSAPKVEEPDQTPTATPRRPGR